MKEAIKIFENAQFGQNRLFQWLRDNGFLCKKGECYNQPTQKAMDMGLFEIKKTVITKPSGDSLVITTTKVTGKGQIYFVNRFLYENQSKARMISKLENKMNNRHLLIVLFNNLDLIKIWKL